MNTNLYLIGTLEEIRKRIGGHTKRRKKLLGTLAAGLSLLMGAGWTSCRLVIPA